MKPDLTNCRKCGKTIGYDFSLTTGGVCRRCNYEISKKVPEERVNVFLIIGMVIFILVVLSIMIYFISTLGNL